MAQETAHRLSPESRRIIIEILRYHQKRLKPFERDGDDILAVEIEQAIEEVEAL